MLSHSQHILEMSNGIRLTLWQAYSRKGFDATCEWNCPDCGPQVRPLQNMLFWGAWLLHQGLLHCTPFLHGRYCVNCMVVTARVASSAYGVMPWHADSCFDGQAVLHAQIIACHNFPKELRSSHIFPRAHCVPVHASKHHVLCMVQTAHQSAFLG